MSAVLVSLEFVGGAAPLICWTLSHEVEIGVKVGDWVAEVQDEAVHKATIRNSESEHNVPRVETIEVEIRSSACVAGFTARAVREVNGDVWGVGSTVWTVIPTVTLTRQTIVSAV